MSDASWIRGFAFGLAEMHRQLIRGNDSDAVRKIAREADVTILDCRTAGVCDFDLRELTKAGVL